MPTWTEDGKVTHKYWRLFIFVSIKLVNIFYELLQISKASNLVIHLTMYLLRLSNSPHINPIL